AKGFAVLDEAMLPVLAEQVPPEWAGDIYCTMIHVCHELADLRRMREWTEAMERWCQKFSSAVMFAGICSVHRLELLSTEGYWDQVEQELGSACTALEGKNGWVAGEGFYQLGEILRLRGDYRAAQHHFDRARAFGIDPQPGEALLQAANHEVDAAWAGLRSALEGRDQLARTRLLGSIVDLALTKGLEDDAVQACAELESIAAQFGSPGFLAWARHARGTVLVHQSRDSEALTVLHAALRAYQDLHAIHDVARVHELIARAHRNQGQHDLARADTEAALTIYRQLRAQPDIRRLSEARACPGGLTARELEVLRQIASGASNREVGASLFITEKTVARHLANIFAKIGVSSRTAAAAWAHSNDVTSSRISS
nr:LuxR family transcriptional regulator [Propionibacteriaceae bacterium]